VIIIPVVKTRVWVVDATEVGSDVKIITFADFLALTTFFPGLSKYLFVAGTVG
jgi:hypothetical protein